MKLLRILYVPNEAGSFRQLGFRRPFANLVDAGLIGETEVFSLQWRILNGGDAEAHRQDLVKRVRDFQPDVLLMQHLGITGLTDKHFQLMRRAADFRLIYHEGDPYSRFVHPLPSAAKAAGRAADVVFTVGSGVFASNFRRAGASDVRWASHVFEPERFALKEVTQPAEKTHDVVIVANRNRPRLRGLPNWRDRIAFVKHLQDRFGDRLAIYGKGWDGVGSMGPVDFSEQDMAIRSGWISANWDHYANERDYFSNRLPISLASGSIHATTRHDGYDRTFKEPTSEFLILGDTPKALAKAIEDRLSQTSEADRILAGRRAQAYAYERFRQDDQIVAFLNFDGPRLDPHTASAAWDTSVQPLQGV